jgi:hypothetical protein
MIWLDQILKISAVGGGTLAVVTFWRAANVRRAEWLSKLHAQFFEGSAYKQIRRALDNSKSPDLLQLQESTSADEDSDLVEAFDVYLNFFEFVASLRKMHQLKTKEISMMFDYYLRLLCKHAFVRDYIRGHGFEELDALIVTCVERKK